MVRLLFTLIVFFSVPTNNYAQQNVATQSSFIPEANSVSVDALTSYIKQNFNGDSARIRAIYIWVTGNISYDVPRFMARDKNPNSPPPTAAEIFLSRTGVCQGYSDLFVALCKGVGLDAIAIHGITKRNGQIGPVSHAWVAAIVDGAWYLFDPTWGAGYVRSNVFVKRFNNEFYQVPPTKFIEDHMPFDPIYQLLSNPLSNYEFVDGKPAAGKSFINYTDSIKHHRQLSLLLQTSAELRRMEAGGLVHNLLHERKMYLKNILQSAASKNSFEEGSTAFKAAISLYQTFLNHKNKQFSTITDMELQPTIDTIEFYIKRSRALVSETVPKTDAQWEAKTRQTASIDKLWVEVIKQKDFILKYLATDKAKRKQLFMK